MYASQQEIIYDTVNRASKWQVKGTECHEEAGQVMLRNKQKKLLIKVKGQI